MSITALLVLAAEAAEPSKVPFYLGGGLFAVWAVTLSVIGLSRPDFPSTPGAARGLYGVSAALMAIAAASAILTS